MSITLQARGRSGVFLVFETGTKPGEELPWHWHFLVKPSAYKLEANEMYQEWISHCKIESNRALVPLDRCEGGLASVDETRQIRGCEAPFIFHTGSFIDGTYFTHHLGFYLRDGVWTYEELCDLRDAFIDMMKEKRTEVLGIITFE